MLADAIKTAPSGDVSGRVRTARDIGNLALRNVPARMWHIVKRFDGAAPVLGRIGDLEVRLARNPGEVKAAQHLRYAVFYEEMSAQPSKIQKVTRRDRDGFDRYCDHLLVIDNARKGTIEDRIVGTYRLLRGEMAALCGGFYTAQEFDIAPMIARHPGMRFLELGRSCVLKDYRIKRVVDLLWQGIWRYVVANEIDVLFGCASLSGTDPEALALPLAFLKQTAAAPEEWQVRAHVDRGTFLSDGTEAVDMRKALSAMPPLLKGYLRLGGYIGEGAVVDHQFGTTDVLVVLPRAIINPRYIDHYGSETRRAA